MNLYLFFESIYVLNIESLKYCDIMFWSVWEDS